MRSKNQSDQSEMLAFFVVNREVESYYNSEQMKNMEKDKKTKASAPPWFPGKSR